jgi:hypothetical protein
MVPELPFASGSTVGESCGPACSAASFATPSERSAIDVIG